MTHRERPILAGLIALVSVSVGLALVFGIGALVLSWGLGLGDSGSSGGNAGGGRTMYLPKPQATAVSTGPLVTLAPNAPSDPASGSSDASETTIVLEAAETAVAPMQQIDLTGSYPGGEGAVLQVQRFANGAWSDFPVTAQVSNATFSTYLQTSQGGKVRFRVQDTDTGATSNEVVVQIG